MCIVSINGGRGTIRWDKTQKTAPMC
uniref:Uncharacterized protein n=1 Tax=Rhizophora mucronata TaxID=61149 RepID=A0A2P2Q256_RHIMU